MNDRRHQKRTLKRKILYLFILFAFMIGCIGLLETYLVIIPCNFYYKNTRSRPIGSETGEFLAFVFPTYRPVHPTEEHKYPFIPDKDCFWRLKPNFTLNYSANLVIPPTILHTNSHGFRGPELSVEKPPQTTRIVCLGDSCTFGYGLTNHQNATYPSQLENMLCSKSLVRRWEVINAGVVGYSSFQGLQFYKKYVKKFAPDVLIIGFGYNDGLHDMHSDAQKYWIFQSYRARLNALLLNLEVWKMMRFIILESTFQVNTIRKGDRMSLPPTSAPRASWEEYQRNIRTLIEDMYQQGKKVILLNTIFKKKYHLPYGVKLHELSEAYKCPYVDLKEVFEKTVNNNLLKTKYYCQAQPFIRTFQSNWDQTMMLMDDNIHPNALGNYIIADTIYHYIRNLTKIEEPVQKQFSLLVK